MMIWNLVNCDPTTSPFRQLIMNGFDRNGCMRTKTPDTAQNKAMTKYIVAAYNRVRGRCRKLEHPLSCRSRVGHVEWMSRRRGGEWPRVGGGGGESIRFWPGTAHPLPPHTRPWSAFRFLSSPIISPGDPLTGVVRRWMTGILRQKGSFKQTSLGIKIVLGASITKDYLVKTSSQRIFSSKYWIWLYNH